MRDSMRDCLVPNNASGIVSLPQFKHISMLDSYLGLNHY